MKTWTEILGETDTDEELAYKLIGTVKLADRIDVQSSIEEFIGAVRAEERSIVELGRTKAERAPTEHSVDSLRKVSTTDPAASEKCTCRNDEDGYGFDPDCTVHRQANPSPMMRPDQPLAARVQCALIVIKAGTFPTPAMERAVRDLEYVRDELRRIETPPPMAGPMLAWKDQDDHPLPEDERIDAAFPTETGRHDLYAEAMRLVGARYSKGGLVALVNWLLYRLALQSDVADAAYRHIHRAEQPVGEQGTTYLKLEGAVKAWRR